MNSHANESFSIHDLHKEQAIEQIMDRHGEELKRFIFTYVKNRTQTDDIFQEVMITVYNKLNTFQERSSLRTWLYRITANKCKDYLRSPIHRMVCWKEQADEKDWNRTPEQTLLHDEEKRAVIRAIMHLPVKYREVLILQYYQEFSMKEISSLLHVNESTVRTRISRAKSKLEKQLREGYFNA